MAIDKLKTTSFLDESVTNLKIAVSARASTVMSSASVGDLSDVDITTSAPTNNQSLIWDNANSKFIPGNSFSQGDFDTALTASDTDDLSEGTTNLYYTDARADARVALVIDSAPGALNTLNELAAALGDDANFSTTVTNSIATKLPLAGGTLTGNVEFGTSNKAKFGTSNQLEIYAGNGDAHIKESGSANFVISGNNMYLTNTNQTNRYFLGNGSTGQVTLYHGSSNEKFKTTSTGATITGDIAVTGTVDGRDVATDGLKLDGIESNAKDDQTITAGTGLTGGGTGDVTLSHADTSSQVSSNNSGRTYIQDITLDTYGHITSLATATETVTNTNLTHTGEVTGSTSLTISDNIVDEANLKVSNSPTDGYFLSAQSGNTGGLTWATVPAGYTDSDVASYLSANDYDTSTNIIAAITDSAPGTLDTLNELAAALGDDASFSTTVTNSIATKLPLAGGTMTGDVLYGDNVKAKFGAGSDLEIYHDGSHSYIEDTGTGSLILRGTSKVVLQSATGTTYFEGTNGSEARVYFNNSTKLKTTSTGINVTGNVVLSGTVDGRDVAADGTKLDGIATSANNYSHPNHTGEVTSTGDGATVIVDNVVDAGNLKVTGNGTTTQFLRSDGDGTFTWATPVDTNTVYTHPTHTGDDISIDTGALTGATVISDLDFNITTDTLGHVTDANGTIATRTLTLANLGYTGETNATADQTNAEIRAAIEAATDSNVFTDADHTKLNAIESGATADQTNAEIRAAIEAATDSNVFTDADHTKLNAIESGATADQTKADIEGLGIDVPAANLTGTIAAARLSTAVTQAESDDSTKIATTAYVVDKITTLIGGAPSTLNDLNELAAAINDDANYNSTLTTALATKLPLAGGTLTGNLNISIPDNGGAPANTAILGIRGYDGRGAGITIRDQANSASGSSNREWFAGSGYNQSGFNIGYSSTATQTSYSAQNKLTITTDGNVGIGTSSPDIKLHTQINTATEWTGTANLSNTTNKPIFALLLDNNDSSITNTEVNMLFSAGASGSGQHSIGVKRTGTNTGDMIFRRRTGGSSSAETMRIDSSGNVGIGTNSPNAFLSVRKDNNNSGNQFVVADTEGVSAAVRTYTYNGDDSGLILNHYYAKSGSGNEYMRYADFVANVGNGAGTTMRFITKNAANTFSVGLTQDNNGNVGIGTDDPYKKLEVTGDLQLDADNASIWLKSGASGTAGKINWTYNTDSTIYASAGLDYDTRATTGFHLDVGYPITIDTSSSTGIKFITAASQRAIINNSGLSVTGNIAVSGTVDGRDVATDGTKLDGIETGATADQTAAQILTAVKTVDGSGSGLDADTVDGLQASSFLRSDADDVGTGKIILGATISAGSSAKLQVGGFQRSGPIMLAVGDSGTTSFNTTNERWIMNDGSHIYASTSSVAYNNKIWTDSNDGSGSGLDADLLDGQHGSYYQKKTTVQDAAPSGATGDLWYESDSGSFYVYYGGAWVDVAPGVETNTNLQINSLGVGTAASSTSGEIRATNDVTAYYSDERLKDFHGNIDSALDKVNQLNGYYFTENETAKELGYDNDKRQVGVSAQEVEAVLPEVVAAAPISDEYLTVKYEKLAPLFIEAIKEIDKKYQDKIDMLMEEIKKLKGN